MDCNSEPEIVRENVTEYNRELNSFDLNESSVPVSTVCSPFQRESGQDEIDIDEVNHVNVSVKDTSTEFSDVNPLIKLIYEHTALNTIVPESSINSYPQPISTGLINCYEGKFTVSESLLRIIFDSATKTFHRKTYPFVIKQLFKNVNNTCILNLKNCNYLKKNIIVYGYCKQNGCKKFKLICSVSNGLDVNVYSSSINFYHSQQLTSQVRGIERSLLGCRLVTSTALKVKSEDVKDSVRMLTQTQNLEKIKSEDVYRKIKSQAIASCDRSSDDVIDFILMQRDNSNYIYKVSQPITALIFSIEQIHFIKNCRKRPNLYLDATGSVVRKPSTSSNRVLYYAGVIHSTSGRILPVLEMVRFFAMFMFKMTGLYKHFCSKNNLKWPPYESVTTDFSFALINAICESWDCMTLQNYCNISFNITVKQKTINTKELIKIKLCCAHVMKLMARDIDINHYFENKRVKIILKECVACMFTLSTFNEIMDILKCLYILTTNADENEAVVGCLKIILSKKSTVDIDYDSISNDTEDNNYNFSIQNNDCFYKNNMFYSYVGDVFSNIKLNAQKSAKKNSFYSKDFIKYFHKHYIPYIALWSNIMYNERTSNAFVENWFGLVKTNILQHKLHLKCSRFLRKVRSHILFLHREEKLKIKRNRCATNVIFEEKWTKKQKRTHTYFKQQTITKINNAEKFIQQKKARKLYEVEQIKDIGRDYVIAKFKEEKLYFSSYKTLFHNKQSVEMWLDNFIINYFLKVICDNTDTKPILTYEVYNILQNRVIVNILDNFKKFLVPIYNQNHWMLMHVNIEQGSMYFFDPANTKSRRGLKFFEKVDNYFKKYSLLPTNFELLNMAYPVQSDSWNCGVYICYYSETLIQGHSFSQNFNPAEYRKYIQSKIINTSESLETVCHICGCENNELFCRICNRWVHKICANVPSSNDPYICDICKKE
ncbi:hypothetical protein RI129_003304 [Pyrocoelia pectoralis]|uniref:Ubiquitin-like protease family profile domain-containing protein n=1 Tax=Pyrocoelia pectoralis TaxID=417401 RepID=A0AAN7ZMW5_9COLE